MAAPVGLAVADVAAALAAELALEAAELREAEALEAAELREAPTLEALEERREETELVVAPAPLPVEVAVPVLAPEVQVAEAGKSDEAETGSQMTWAYARAATWSAASHALKTQQPILSRKLEAWQIQSGLRLQLEGSSVFTHSLAHEGSVAAVCAEAIPTSKVEARIR